MTTNGSDTGNGRANGSTPKIVGEPLRPPLPKRFYKAVAVAPRDGRGFAITLDGRPVRTPAKNELVLPVETLAEAVAAEWEAQGTHIDPASMLLTRLVNTALDAVANAHDAVAEDVVSFAGSDLLCYRADGPEALADRQAEAWDPLLAWASEDLGASLNVQVGLMPIDQPQAAREGMRRALAGIDALRLAAVHVVTTLTGSAVLAVAVLRERLTPDDAWAAANIDEAWQIEQWGQDAEAEARAEARRAEFMSAARCLRLLK